MSKCFKSWKLELELNAENENSKFMMNEELFKFELNFECWKLNCSSRTENLNWKLKPWIEILNWNVNWKLKSWIEIWIKISN
jgi:hypothetical protein